MMFTILSVLLVATAYPEGLEGLLLPSERLIDAVESNNTQLCRELINDGADVNMRSTSGKAAIMQAVEVKNVDIVDMLLFAGADPNIVHDHLKPPLLEATDSNSVEIVKRLIEGKADVNIRDTFGDTALHYTAKQPKNGQTEIAQLLIDARAKLGLRNTFGGCTVIFGIPIEMIKRKIHHDNFKTPLHMAAYYGNKEVCARFLHHDALVNSKDTTGGNTALMIAIQNGRTSLLVLLLQWGADVTIRNNVQKSAIDLAVGNPDIQAIVEEQYCHPIPLPVTNGEVSSPTTSVGKSINVTCNGNVEETYSLLCQQNGLWDDIAPLCPDIVSSGSDTSIQLDNARITGITIASLVLVISVVTATIVIVALSIRRRRKRRQTQQNGKPDGLSTINQYETHELNETSQSLLNIPTEDEKEHELLSLLKELKLEVYENVMKLHIEHQRVELGKKVLGEGNFGAVYKGTYNSVEGQKPIAVKTLKGSNPSPTEYCEFLEEATMMMEFHDENVLTLYGVMLMENRPYVILPLMEYGDLRSYVANPKNRFSVEVLLDYGLQIAKGMKYLANMKFVHRDLAARNCMINKENVVKIADFGLARDIYEKDYYRIDDFTRPLPRKWMALESLRMHVFSTKSDVWSYGVTLWEILMRGTTPYPDIDIINITRYLQEGNRMAQPPFCPDQIYALMKNCWKSNPDDRPTFKNIHEFYKDFASSIKQSEEINATEEVEIDAMYRKYLDVLGTKSESTDGNESEIGNQNKYSSNENIDSESCIEDKGDNDNDGYLKPVGPKSHMA